MRRFTGVDALVHVIFEHVVIGTIDFGSAIAEIRDMEEVGWESFDITPEEGQLLTNLGDVLQKTVLDISDSVEAVLLALPNLVDRFTDDEIDPEISTIDELLIGSLNGTKLH